VLPLSHVKRVPQELEPKLVPTYNIFAGRYGDTDAYLIEPVEGLGCAYERMKEIAAKERGPYFIFEAHSHRVLASVDTTASKCDSAKSA
jgi:hypothetical protein